MVIPVEVCSACKCWRISKVERPREVRLTATSWKLPCYACRTWLAHDPVHVFPPMTPPDPLPEPPNAA